MNKATMVIMASLCALTVATAAQTPATKPAPSMAIPPALNDGWKTGSPEEAGIDSRRLDEMTESIRAHPEYNVHAVVIERDGRLVYEAYFSGTDERWGQRLGSVTFTRSTLHDIR